MTGQECWKILEWSDKYIQHYFSGDTETKEILLPKMHHAVEVGLEAHRIAISLNLSDGKMSLAQAAGLLHDIGRFEQYTRYKTFIDHRSINHAMLGATIVRKNKVLENIDLKDAESILFAIENHNCFAIPSERPDPMLLKILRDADKIDILQIMTNHFDDNENRRNKTLELDLTDTKHVSSEVGDAIKARRIVRTRDIKNLNDLKLLYASWIFDMNFPYTFRIVREKRYLEKLRNSLPANDDVYALFTIIEKYFADNSLACG